MIATSAGAQDSLATAVKASYLAKLAPFIIWPSDPLVSGAFTICVVGKDPFGAVLDRAVSGQQIGGLPVTVSRLATIQTRAPCRIAFLSGSRAQGVKDALSALRGTPVLTVTDSGSPQGIIDFAIVDGRVRFRVDDEAAAENGLGISSKLLSLAVSVRPRRSEPGSDQSAADSRDAR